MSVTVYTAAFNCSPPPPPQKVGIARYICYADAMAKPKWPWHHVPISWRSLNEDPARAAKIIKIKSHVYTSTDYSIWVDASMALQVTPEELPRYDLAAHNHFERTCIYDEADAVIADGLDDYQTICAHLKFMLAVGYPANNGLHDTSFIIRHNVVAEKFNALWLEAFNIGSRRDQLSFDFASWQSGLKCTDLPGHTRTSKTLSPFLNHVGLHRAIFRAS